MKSHDIVEHAGGYRENLERGATLGIFDGEVVAFLDTLSKEIFSNVDCRAYPDLITFGFFCRKRNLLSNHEDSINFRSGRGLLFHIAPSNVPINYAYSLVCGLVTGNRNVVKISSKYFPQVELLNSIIGRLIDEQFKSLRQFISIIQYDNQQYITDELSKRCDSRIIWGGNETIKKIRQSPIQPFATDVVFYNRTSFLLIDSTVVDENNIDSVFRDFYNDTFLSDQDACTSPKIIFWLGDAESVTQSRRIFWKYLVDYIRQNHHFEESSTFNKYYHFCKIVARSEFDNFNHDTDDFYIFNNLVDVHVLDQSMFYNNGFFWESRLNDIHEFSGFLASIDYKPQTLIYYGFPDIALLIKEQSLHFYFDRIVPLGRSMDFSFVWDGYNLLHTLSKTTKLTK